MEDSDDAKLQRLWFATKQLSVARRPVTAAEASSIQTHHGTYQDNKGREDGERQCKASDPAQARSVPFRQGRLPESGETRNS